MALGTRLPFWPALLFTYIEPIMLIMGANTAYNHPTEFIQSQIPTSPLIATLASAHPGALVLSYTLANIFVLLMGIAVLCTAVTREPRVTKGYLLMVAVGDLGHVYCTYKVAGPQLFWNFGEWNQMMWGNVGASLFLNVNRWATLMGLFGRIKGGR